MVEVAAPEVFVLAQVFLSPQEPITLLLWVVVEQEQPQTMWLLQADQIPYLALLHLRVVAGEQGLLVLSDQRSTVQTVALVVALLETQLQQVQVVPAALVILLACRPRKAATEAKHIQTM